MALLRAPVTALPFRLKPPAPLEFLHPFPHEAIPFHIGGSAALTGLFVVGVDEGATHAGPVEERLGLAIQTRGAGRSSALERLGLRALRQGGTIITIEIPQQHT